MLVILDLVVWAELAMKTSLDTIVPEFLILAKHVLLVPVVLAAYPLVVHQLLKQIVQHWAEHSLVVKNAMHVIQEHVVIKGTAQTKEEEIFVLELFMQT
jgi:hypothetical protein